MLWHNLVINSIAPHVFLLSYCQNNTFISRYFGSLWKEISSTSDDILFYTVSLVLQSFSGSYNLSLNLSAFINGHKLLSSEDYFSTLIGYSFHTFLKKFVTFFPNDALMLTSISHSFYVCRKQKMFENNFPETNEGCWQKDTLGTVVITPLHRDRLCLWEDGITIQNLGLLSEEMD